MKTIAILSIKGGVGKTTVTANLGLAFIRLGLKTAFCDLDISGPNLHIPLEIDIATPAKPLPGGKFDPLRQDNFQFLSIGQFYDKASVNLWDDAMRESAVKQLLPAIVWDPEPDYLLVDTPPTSSSEIQSLLKMRCLYGAVVVAEPSRLALEDTAKTFSLLKYNWVPTLGMVVNRDGPNPYYSDGVWELASREKVPHLGSIPLTLEPGDFGPHFDLMAKRVLGRSPLQLTYQGFARRGRRFLTEEAIRVATRGMDEPSWAKRLLNLLIKQQEKGSMEGLPSEKYKESFRSLDGQLIIFNIEGKGGGRWAYRIKYPYLVEETAPDQEPEGSVVVQCPDWVLLDLLNGSVTFSEAQAYGMRFRGAYWLFHSANAQEILRDMGSWWKVAADLVKRKLGAKG